MLIAVYMGALAFWHIFTVHASYPPPHTHTPWLLPPLCAAATFILINVRSTVVAHLEEQRADISDPADPAALLE